MKKHKLLIDIGNTNTSIAVTRGRKILKKYFIHTSKDEVKPSSLRRLLRKYLPGMDGALIVSVVPEFLKIVESSVKSVLPGVALLVVGRDVKVPMRVKYGKPRQVGQDRLVVSYAASRLSGCPVLIIDFGTAVTFDLVNARGEYEGGLIFPGLRLGLQSLADNTALLPRIEVRPVKGLIGKDTRGSMNKGVLLGYAALCDGLIRRFKKEHGGRIKVIATGGDARLVARYSSQMKKVLPDLIFSGMISLSAGDL